MGGGAGLVTLVHHSLNFVQIASPLNDGVAEVIIISSRIADLGLNITNLYVPPQSSCLPNFVSSIAPLLSNDNLIIGDVNGHNNLWSLGRNDGRGDSYADEIDNGNFVVLNDIPTRPSSNSSPDIAIASTSFALSLDWTAISTLNSDHLPVAISVEDDTPVPRLMRSFTNYRKANWAGFKQETELHFAHLPLPTSCSQGEKLWRRVILKA